MLVGEIMGDISNWRKLRDGDFEALWDEFYAKWRGFWFAEHRSFKTERSKLISPLTSMAVDLTTAEIVEAVLGREYFIDLPDDVLDQDTTDMEIARTVLVADLKDAGFVEQFALTALNGSLYGTGIMKVQIGTKIVKKPVRREDGSLTVAEEEIVSVKPIAIEPGQFVGDPNGATCIDDMQGCAHEFPMPLHKIREKQGMGVYYGDISIGAWDKPIISPNRGDTEAGNRKRSNNVAFVTEYYGLVPTRLYMQAVAEGNGTELPDEMVEAIGEFEVTEVIATIANETHLLRVIENPLITGERLMMSYQHESVPGRFYGRGVAEKAASVQRAMDAEMRARIDGLAWANNPMFAGDLTRMPPGANMNAWPGKFWGTRGNPTEVLSEFRIQGPDQNTYAHIQDLERMGQQATGAADSAGLRAGMRDETATGSALAASSFIKRSKRTMYNIEEFLNRLITRIARLKMQYEPTRYPQDYEFRVRGAIGMMAREIEQQFMVNLASTLGPEHAASMPIIKAIFEHSGSPVKAEVLQALKALEEKQPSPEEQAAQAAQLALPVAQLEKIKAETYKITQEGDYKEAQTEEVIVDIENAPAKQNIENIRALNDLKETENQELQLDLLAEKNQIQREALQSRKKD
jgi:hypothetical protein